MSYEIELDNIVSELTEENTILKQRNSFLEKENSKLKCLALHLMSDFLLLKNRWIRYFIDSHTGRRILSEYEIKERRNKAARIERHGWFYLEAYRKAKKKLKETK